MSHVISGQPFCLLIHSQYSLFFHQFCLVNLYLYLYEMCHMNKVFLLYFLLLWGGSGRSSRRTGRRVRCHLWGERKRGWCFFTPAVWHMEACKVDDFLGVCMCLLHSLSSLRPVASWWTRALGSERPSSPLLQRKSMWRIEGDLLAEMELNIQNYIFINV